MFFQKGKVHPPNFCSLNHGTSNPKTVLSWGLQTTGNSNCPSSRSVFSAAPARSTYWPRESQPIHFQQLLRQIEGWWCLASHRSSHLWCDLVEKNGRRSTSPKPARNWNNMAIHSWYPHICGFFPIQALQAKLTQAKVFGQHAGWETILQLPLSSHPTLLATFSGDMSAWLSIETRGRNKPQIRLFFRLFLHTPWFSRVVSRMHLFPGPACHINDDEKQQQGPGQCFEGTHDAWTHQTNVNQPTSLATVWSWVINSSICSFHG